MDYVKIYATKVDNYAEGDYMNTVHMWTYNILGSGIYDDTTFEYEPTAFYPEMEDLSNAVIADVLCPKSDD